MYTYRTHYHLTAECLKSTVMLRVFPAHRVGHGASEAEGWRHGLGILTEDEPEINVKHLSGGIELRRI